MTTDTKRPDSSTVYRRMVISCLIHRDGWNCHYCGEELVLTDIKQVVIDHKDPVSRGGALFDAGNLVLSCRKCNADKSDKPYKAYLELLKRRNTAILNRLTKS